MGKGILVPLFKSGDNLNPDNYRGITLSSILGKTLSLVLTKRLQLFLESENILHKAQAGFRDGFRTSDNLFVLKQLIKHYKAINKPLYTCFVDFQKAFDRVNQKALLCKLLDIGVGGRFYPLVKDMYSDNLACIRTESGTKCTEYFKCNVGVRQGDPMSPTLFNILINKLAFDLDSINTAAPKIKSITESFRVIRPNMGEVRARTDPDLATFVICYRYSLFLLG